MAISKEMPDVALEIIQRGDGKSNSHVDDNTDTALIYAINSNMLDVANALLDKGGCGVGHINKHGNSALIYAINNGYVDLATRIINSGQPNYQVITADNTSSLMLAIGNGMFELAEWLIDQNYPGFNGHINNEGDTALLLCIINDREDLALKILRLGHSNYDIITKENDTSLLIAVHKEMYQLAKEIILLGGHEFINHKNSFGFTAKDIAIVKGNQDIISII